MFFSFSVEYMYITIFKYTATYALRYHMFSIDFKSNFIKIFYYSHLMNICMECIIQNNTSMLWYGVSFPNPYPCALILLTDYHLIVRRWSGRRCIGSVNADGAFYVKKTICQKKNFLSKKTFLSKTIFCSKNNSCPKNN